MRKVWVALACILWSVFTYGKELVPVTISTPTPEVWVGERARITVELRAFGSFSGTASFDLPELEGTLLMKTGNPVVSSREEGGKSLFIQTHDFSLFSQREGPLTIPSFSVRFAAREGFTGDATDVVAETQPIDLTIKRPPGSGAIPFLVTSPDLKISQIWDPDVTEAKVGHIIRRTISQRSTGLTGIALQPAPRGEVPGVRIYEPQVETRDDLERGSFVGERTETLTYLIQDSGDITLPDFSYAWWNPERETLEQDVLTGLSLFVAAPPLQDSTAEGKRIWLPALLAVAAILVVLVIRSRLLSAARAIWRWLNPPDRVAARRLRQACRQGNASGAAAAWTQWRESSEYVVVSRPMQEEVLAMHRSLYGKNAPQSWEGDTFLAAFSEVLKGYKERERESPGFAIPPLNGETKLEQSVRD
ncbi:MAG: hypothetical protein AAGC68_17045 [Verrucomicrobiota bacterium]